MFFIHPARDMGKQIAGEKKETVQGEEPMLEKGRTSYGGVVAETEHLPPGEDKAPCSGCSSSTAKVQQEATAPQLFSPAAALNKALSIQERPPALTQTLEKPPLTTTSPKKSPGTPTTLPQTLEELLVSPPPQEMIPSTISATSASPEKPQVSPLSHGEKGPGTLPATVDPRNSTQERREVVTKQHTTKAEPADQRTEPPLSE